MARIEITIPGASIVPGDILKRLPGVQIVDVEPVDPRYPHSQTMRMADGSYYFADPAQMYVVFRDVPGKSDALTGVVLVVGPCQTEGERADLRAWAYDVCDQMCVSVVVATHDQYNVRDFGAVYVYGRSLADGATTGSYDPYGIVLEAEAWAYGVPVITPQSVRLAAPCDACGQYQTINAVRNGHGEVFCFDCQHSGRCTWCAEDTVTDPFPTPDGWTPFCKPCATTTRRVAKAKRVSRRRVTIAV